MSSKGKTRVECAHPGCDKRGFLSVSERSCLQDDGIAWMCARHDDQRTVRENQRTIGCNSSSI